MSGSHPCITPIPPQTTALTELRLVRSGTFPNPPDLGRVLAEQLENLSFENIGINTVPETYFQNYSNLIYLKLNAHPITHLNAGILAGIGQLKYLHLDRTNINPVPPLDLSLPNLRILYIAEVGISLLPETLMKNLPHLRKLDLRSNQLSILPDEEYFVNLQNMDFVRLQGNPLRCDAGIAWIKVHINMCIAKE